MYICDVNRSHPYQDNVLWGTTFVGSMNLCKASLHTLEQERYSFYNDFGTQFHSFYCKNPIYPSLTNLHSPRWSENKLNED